MAVTTPTVIDSSIPELWAKLVLRDHLRAGFWKNMLGGEASGMPIIQKSDLLNNPGDTIHIQTTAPLVGAGVEGDTAVLEGNEEALATASKKVIPVLYRHAVRVNRRANKKSIVDLRSEAKLRLAEWGEEKMDDKRFANFVSTAAFNGEVYTPNLVVAGNAGVGGTIDDVAAGDKLTVALIQKLKLVLQNNRAKPLKFGGVPMFAMVVHPNTLYDLKRESEYSNWVREAAVRGESNPFFIGATAMIDGCIIFEHPNVPTASNSGSVLCSKNMIFGAEAFVEGVDENVSWAEDSFDYGKEFGVAYSFAFQPRRALEKNSLNVYAAATAP